MRNPHPLISISHDSSHYAAVSTPLYTLCFDSNITLYLVSPTPSPVFIVISSSSAVMHVTLILIVVVCFHDCLVCIRLRFESLELPELSTQDSSKSVYMDLRCVRRVPKYRLTTSHNSAITTLTPSTSKTLINVLESPGTEDCLRTILSFFTSRVFPLSPVNTDNLSSTETIASDCHFYHISLVCLKLTRKLTFSS